MVVTRNNLLSWTILLPALLPLACGPARPQPSPIGHFVLPNDRLQHIQRVVFIELEGPPGYPQIAQGLTQELFQAIQVRQLFRMELLARGDKLYGDLPPINQDGCSFQDLSTLRKLLKCDVVLLGRVSQFQPHPHMRLGLDLKLLDVKSGKLLWAINHTWDTSDKLLQRRIDEYYEDNLARQYQPIDWRLALVSPRAFAKFIAFESAGTLPNGAPEPPPPGQVAGGVKKAQKLQKSLSSE